MGLGLFVLIIAALLVPTFIHTETPAYRPRIVGIAIPAMGLAIDTVTIDAGAEHRWRFFDFERGLVSDPPDTTGWDIAFQRFHVIPSGEIANLGSLAFDSVLQAPDSGYVRTTFGRDTVNAATARWYTYSYFSHLLTPKPDVFALRTREGRLVKLQIFSYYCPGPTPGCVTFRYGWLGAGRGVQ
ncbi:MAG: hypothetical protein EXR93_02120 [Gemmatimonadetes bacterium]|nr:hypothetical protein [Gemmatimonadota bacterium]